MTSWSIMTHHKTWKNDKNLESSLRHPLRLTVISLFPFRRLRFCVKNPSRSLVADLPWSPPPPGDLVSNAVHKTRVIAVITFVLVLCPWSQLEVAETFGLKMLKQCLNNFNTVEHWETLRNIERSGQVMQRVHNGHTFEISGVNRVTPAIPSNGNRRATPRRWKNHLEPCGTAAHFF